MNKVMKSLTEMFYGTRFESNSMSELSSSTEKYVRHFNDTLGLEDKRKEKFVSEDNGYLLAPVAVSGVQNTDKIDLVYMGLNPKFGEDGKKGLGTWDEKRAASEHPEGYYDFYNSYAIFDYLMDGKDNTYYQRFMRVLMSVFGDESGDTIGIDQVREKYGNGKDDKHSDHIAFRELTKDLTVIIPELIPLHSWQFSISPKQIGLLKSKYPPYGDYLISIFDFITEHISSSGLVIANGLETTVVLRELLLSGDLGEKANKIYSDLAMDVYEWKQSKWLLLKAQIAPGHSPIYGAKNMATFGKKVNEIRNTTDYYSIMEAKYYTKDGRPWGSKKTKENNQTSKALVKKKVIKEVKAKPVLQDKAKTKFERKLSADEKKQVRSLVERVCLEYDLLKNKGYFYPKAVEAYKPEGVSGNPHAVSFEILYPKNGVAFALQLFGSDFTVTQQLVANYLKSSYPFKKVDVSKFSNRKILPNVIHRWDEDESIESILMHIETNLRTFLESDLEWLAKDLWSSLDRTL